MLKLPELSSNSVAGSPISTPLCGKELAACNLPSSTLFALAFRKNEIFAPSGNTVFQPGDTVVAVVTPDVEKELEPLFPEK